MERNDLNMDNSFLFMLKSSSLWFLFFSGVDLYQSKKIDKKWKLNTKKERDFLLLLFFLN